MVPWFLDHRVAQTDSGHPRSSKRLRTLMAILVSTSCAGRLWERKMSPSSPQRQLSHCSPRFAANSSSRARQ